MFKKALSIFLFLVALYFLLISFFMFSGSNLVDHSLKNSKSIELVFLKAKSYIENYKLKNNSYPSAQEFKKWSHELPKDKDLYYPITHINYSQTNYPEEAISLFGEPKTKDHYLLFLWRGEWFEYYPSWTQKSSLPLKVSDYYYFGSMVKDVIVLLLLSFILILVSRKIYPKSLKTK